MFEFSAIQIFTDMDIRVYNKAMKQMFCYTISRILLFVVDILNSFFFKHDGAPPHYATVVQNYATAVVQRKIIGR